MAIGALGIYYLALFCGYFPYAAIKRAAKVREETAKARRGKLVLSVVVSQTLFAAFAILVARFEWIVLFRTPRAEWASLWLALAFFVVWLGTAPFRWSSRSPEKKRELAMRIPRRAGEFWGWGLISLSAGVTEEIVFRGTMVQLWERVLGWYWPAVLVSALCFALVHAYQGWRSVALIFPIAISFHVIVLITGDLYTTMAVHFLYDFAVVAIFYRLATKEGFLPAAEPASEEPPPESSPEPSG